MSEQATQGQPVSNNASSPAENAATTEGVERQTQTMPTEVASQVPDRDGNVRLEVPRGYVSQETVGKAAGKARDEGRKAAVNELLQGLGLESTDDLQSIVQERRQAQEAQATEAEKLQKNLQKVAKDYETTKAELEEAYSHIAQITQERALSNAFIEAGVKPDRMGAALKLADMDSLDIDDNGQVTGSEKVVEALQAQVPEWFAQPSRSIGTGSNPGVDQMSQPGFDQMDDAAFQEMRRRVMFGERIPLK